MSSIRQLSPVQAWEICQQTPEAIILDVRDPVEFNMIGHPPKAMNVPWKYAPEWNINPRFSAKIKELIPARDQTLLILCRSGQRSLEAAEILEHEGYTNLINITEGFEGPLDENKHRGNMGGWRFHKLPWVQN